MGLDALPFFAMPTTAGTKKRKKRERERAITPPPSGRLGLVSILYSTLPSPGLAVPKHRRSLEKSLLLRLGTHRERGGRRGGESLARTFFCLARWLALGPSSVGRV